VIEERYKVTGGLGLAFPMGQFMENCRILMGGVKAEEWGKGQSVEKNIYKNASWRTAGGELFNGGRGVYESTLAGEGME